jgi:hypothetical protein
MRLLVVNKSSPVKPVPSIWPAIDIVPRVRSVHIYLWPQITASLYNILVKPLSREFITLKISVSIKINNIGRMFYNPKFLMQI